MSADYKIATGLFHFCLDKAAVLNDFPRSAFFFLNRTASVWLKEAYSVFVFVLLAHPDHIVCIGPNRPLQTKKPLKQLRKPPQPPAIFIANEAKIGNKSEFDYSL